MLHNEPVLDIIVGMYDLDYGDSYFEDFYHPYLKITLEILGYIICIGLVPIFLWCGINFFACLGIFIGTELVFILTNIVLVKYLSLWRFDKNRDGLYRLKEKFEDCKYQASCNYSDFRKEIIEYYETNINRCQIVLNEIEEQEKKALEANVPVDENKKKIEAFEQEFVEFIEYLKENSSIFENTEIYEDVLDCNSKIEEKGNQLFTLVKKNPESQVFLQKTFDIYVDEIISINKNFQKVDELNTKENYDQYIKVLVNFYKYLQVLKNKIIESKALNLEVSMKTILKEFDIDTSNDNEKGDNK